MMVQYFWFIEISPVVSHKKSFKIFYIDIEGKIGPAHFIEGNERNISAMLYWNRYSDFWKEDFKSYLYRYIGKKSTTPWRPCFCD